MKVADSSTSSASFVALPEEDVCRLPFGIKAWMAGVFHRDTPFHLYRASPISLLEAPFWESSRRLIVRQWELGVRVKREESRSDVRLGAAACLSAHVVT
jgi:hypothetical protein